MKTAYFNGRFVEPSELFVPVYDTGFMMGATVAEQIRTFAGTPFWLDSHLERLFGGLDIAGFRPAEGRFRIRKIVETIIDENYCPRVEAESECQPDDIGITIFVTPGPYPTYGITDQGPLIGIHAYHLQFQNWASKYREGVRTFVSSIRQIPNECWPTHLKCRSRMHYFLAMKEARQRTPGSVPILLNLDGFVTETPTANIIGFRADKGFLASRVDHCLPGISLAYIRQLARRLDIPFVHQSLLPEDLKRCDEVLLASTSSCVLPVTEVDTCVIGDGTPGATFRMILNEWSKDVGVDIERQAISHS